MHFRYSFFVITFNRFEVERYLFLSHRYILVDFVDNRDNQQAEFLLQIDY